MDYFEKKMCQRLVMPTGQTDQRKDEELFYASYGEETAFWANLWGALRGWFNAPGKEPEPAILRKAIG